MSRRREQPPTYAGRVPPHDLDAEAAVISASMLHADARDDALTVLEPGHFYSEANGKIWGAIVDLAQRGQPVDLVQVVGWLRSHGEIEAVGGAKYVGQLIDATPDVANVKAHAQTVWSKAQRRSAIAAFLKLLHEGYGFDFTDEDYMTMVDQQVTQVLSQTFGASGPRHIRDILVNTMKAIDEAATKGPGHDAIPTPLAELTEKLGGGARGGNLITIAGRPGHGKTTLSDQWGILAATEREVGMHGWVYQCSLEMPGEQKASRWLSSLSLVPLKQLRTGLLTQEQWSDVTTGAATLASLPIWVDDQPASPVRVAAEARKLARKAERSGSRLAMVIVDYLQIMRLPPSETRERAVADASASMKALALELKCPVLQLAQLNRKVDYEKNPRPNQAHLKESGAIEADSDIIIFVYRPEKYAQFADDPELRGVAEVVLSKQRDGEEGVIVCRFDGAHTRFVDAEPEREPPPPDDNWQDYERIANEAGL